MRKAIVISLLMVGSTALLAGMLFVSGFCFKEMRYLSEEELIEIALSRNLRLHAPDMERTKTYSSTADILAKNPGCCRVLASGGGGKTYPAYDALPSRTVEIKYLIKEDKGTVYQSFVVMSNCGKILDTYGTIDRE